MSFFNVSISFKVILAEHRNLKNIHYRLKTGETFRYNKTTLYPDNWRFCWKKPAAEKIIKTTNKKERSLTSPSATVHKTNDDDY